jgi:hypothetical protein
MSFESHLEPFLDPLRQRIKNLEDRLRHTEETLAQVLKTSPASLIEKEIIPPLQSISFLAKPGPYAYRPLDPASDETRLLAVYQSKDEQDPITCELLHVSLNDMQDYSERSSQAIESFRTLSYTWGDPTTTHAITIEGHEFPVTQNLAAALGHIRRLPREGGAAAQPTFWWIDAVCINQADVTERNRQVNLMTRIYRKAQGVHIWLGDDDEDSVRAMGLVRQLGLPVPRGPGDSEVELPCITPTERDAHWRALTALFARPWWERVWIRQEVAVAKEATVHCGREACPFSAFAMTANILNQIDEQLGSVLMRHERTKGTGSSSAISASPYLQACVVAGFRTAEGRLPNVKYRDLVELLLHTRSCQATDLRDKVFSMLGLVDPKIWDLHADYRLSLADVLVHTARRIITKTRSLDLFSGGQNPDRCHGLPSWVPNLIDVWKARPLPYRMKPNLGHVPADEESDFVFEGDDEELLRARGRPVDVVSQLAKGTPQEQWTVAQIDALSATWREFTGAALANPKVHMFDKKFAEEYQAKDAAWLTFLSIGKDQGKPRLVNDAPLKIRGDFRMVQRLLLAEDINSSSFGDLGQRIQAQLRKFGVGRCLSITRLGTVVLVPADSRAGDEIWMFRGTRATYVLRRVGDRRYVVVGDACEY